MNYDEGVSVDLAADLLGITYAALRRRLTRAHHKMNKEGDVEVDLGHGVTAVMYPFRRKWTVFIPQRVINAMNRRSAKKRPKKARRSK